MIFRFSYDVVELTRRTLRFNFDNTKQTITFINSYSSKTLIINYSELISIDRITINVDVPIKIDVINCMHNIRLYLLSNKIDYSQIKSYIDNQDTPLNLSSSNENVQRLFSAIKDANYAHDVFILASDSQYELNISKVKSIISTN